jgi:tetratricopeptide (TPR) repeat protein
MLSLRWLLFATPASNPSFPPNTSSGVDPAFVSFAREVEASLREGDPAVLDARVDVDQLLQRATRGLPFSKVFVDEWTGEVRESGLRLGGRLLDGGAEGLRARLLRVWMQGHTPRALFRLLSSSRLNYFEFELGRNARNEVVIFDIYPYMAGEFLSESLRRVYLMAAAEEGQGLSKGLSRRDRGLLGNMSRLRRVHRLLESESYREAVEELDRLPPAVLGEKSFQIIRLKALVHMDEADYLAGLLAFEKAFPGDAALDLFSLGNPLLRGDASAMMETIDRLDRRVEDPYLHYLRGTVKVEQEDLAGARRFFQKAIQEEPALFEPYVELLNLAIQESDHAGAVHLLEALERDTGMDVLRVSVEDSPLARGFLESAEYKAWRERRSRGGTGDGGSDTAGPDVP